MAQHASRALAGEAAAGSGSAVDPATAFPGEIAWVDGAIVPRERAALPLSDSGFVLGATVTEQLRTFGGRLFLPEPHAARMRDSLAIVGTDPGRPLADVFAAAAEVAAANHRALSAARPGWDGDLGVIVFLTPGDLAAQVEGRPAPPRTVIHTFPLAFRLWHRGYDTGLALRSVGVRQVPDACWPLAAKVRSRLHYHLADREASAAEPHARGILCHADGRVSETSTANIAVVRDGRIATPPAADALPGVSLAFARKLAAAAGIAWEPRSLTAADLAAADEILLTSTPSCILPATRFDGRSIGSGGPGPVFRRLLADWSAAVGLDIAGQARRCAAG